MNGINALIEGLRPRQVGVGRFHFDVVLSYDLDAVTYDRFTVEELHCVPVSGFNESADTVEGRSTSRGCTRTEWCQNYFQESLCYDLWRELPDVFTRGGSYELRGVIEITGRWSRTAESEDYEEEHEFLSLEHQFLGLDWGLSEEDRSDRLTDRSFARI